MPVVKTPCIMGLTIKTESQQRLEEIQETWQKRFEYHTGSSCIATPTTGSNIVFPSSRTKVPDEPPYRYPPFILKTKKGETVCLRVPNQYGWNIMRMGTYYDYTVSQIKEYLGDANIPKDAGEIIYSSYGTFLVKTKEAYILMDHNEILALSTPEEVAQQLFPWLIFESIGLAHVYQTNPLLLANWMLKPFRENLLTKDSEITVADYEDACREATTKTPFDLPFHNIRFINLVAGEFAFTGYDMDDQKMKVAFNSHQTNINDERTVSRTDIERHHNVDISCHVWSQAGNVKKFLKAMNWSEPEIQTDRLNRVFLIMQDGVVVAVSAAYPSCFVATDTIVSTVREFQNRFVRGLNDKCSKEIRRIEELARATEGYIRKKWSISHFVFEKEMFGVPKEFYGNVPVASSHPDDDNPYSYGMWIIPFMIHSKVCDQLQIDINFDFLYNINNPKACVDRLRFWYINPIISVIRDYQKAMKDTYDGLVEILGYKPYCPLKGGGIS